MAGNALLRFEPGLMIWTVIVFLVLLAALRKIAWKPLLSALDEREKKIKEALEQAEKTQKDSEKVIAESRRQAEDALRKADEVVQQARQDAEKMRQKAIEEAKMEAKRVQDQGLQRLEAEKRAAIQEIRRTAGDLAIQAAARLIESSLNEQQQREIVDRFLAEVDQQQAN